MVIYLFVVRRLQSSCPSNMCLSVCVLPYAYAKLRNMTFVRRASTINLSISNRHKSRTHTFPHNRFNVFVAVAQNP